VCVVLYKPAGLRLPSVETLIEMSNANNDGLGFMYPVGKKIVGEKFLKFLPFREALEKIPRSLPIVLHFRLATHGGKDIGHAQPFPFPVATKEELFVEKWEAPVGVAHNGIISGFGDGMWSSNQGGYLEWINGEQKRKVWDYKKKDWVYVEAKKEEKLSLSDTQDFLWFLSEHKSLVRSVLTGERATFTLFKKFVGTKFLFFYGDVGKVKLLGDWTQEKGLWFSNTYWKTRVAKKVATYGGRVEGMVHDYRQVKRYYHFEGDGEKGSEGVAKEGAKEGDQPGQVGASEEGVRKLLAVSGVEEDPWWERGSWMSG
jgi:hypothetical protein